jgi:hypothetical protein
MSQKHVIVLAYGRRGIGGRGVEAGVARWCADERDGVVAKLQIHANAYVAKPVDLDQFVSAVRQIDKFFLQVVRLGV